MHPLRTDLCCPRCGHDNLAGTVHCFRCGQVLGEPVGDRPKKTAADPLVESAVTRIAWKPREEPEREEADGRASRTPEREPGAALFTGVIGVPTRDPDPPVLGVPAPVFALLAGALLSPLLTFGPLLQRVGWLLTAIVHELGHVLAAMAMGCSALPAIRLDGHAITMHGPQVIPIAVGIWIGIGVWGWFRRDSLGWLLASALGFVVYPLLAFTGARELVHLLGGHAFELLLSGILLWRALDGGFTRTCAERVAHATLGWYLVGSNVWLCAGLLWNQRIQHWYATSGSFGVQNDYARIADEILGLPLELVAGAMLVASVIVVPLTLLLYWTRR